MPRIIRASTWRDTPVMHGVRPPRAIVFCLLLVLATLEAHAAGGSSATVPDGDPHSRALDGIRGLIKADDLANAQTRAREELARLEGDGRGQGLEAADTIDALVEILSAVKKGRSPEAAQLAERSLRIKESVLGPDDLRVAKAQTALAGILSLTSVTPAAIAL